MSLKPKNLKNFDLTLFQSILYDGCFSYISIKPLFFKKNRSFPTTDVQIITLKPEKCVKLALFPSVFHGFCSYVAIVL